jgi:hypothetical protein
MGVVYKLKDEVVDFILRQKQENPNISCRKLVDIIQETFQISVSKSSINIIIKQANLSNPVGRTPGGPKNAFKIPQDKKTELFFKTKSTLEDVLGAALPTTPPAVSAPAVPAPPVKPPPVLTKKDDVSDIVQEGLAAEPKESVSLSPLDKPLAGGEAQEVSAIEDEPKPSLLSDPVPSVPTDEKSEMPPETASEAIEPPQLPGTDPIQDAPSLAEPPPEEEINKESGPLFPSEELPSDDEDGVAKESVVEDEPKPSLLSDPVLNVPTDERIEAPPIINETVEQGPVTEPAQDTASASEPSSEDVIEDMPAVLSSPDAVENLKPEAETASGAQAALPSDPLVVEKDPQSLPAGATEESSLSPDAADVTEHAVVNDGSTENLSVDEHVDEHVDEPRVSLLPDPISRPPEQEAETQLPSVEPAPPKGAGELFENVGLNHLLLRCALWDLSRRPFLEKFLKNHTDLTDEDIQILDAMMCLWGPVLDDPSKALESDRAWIWRLNGFQNPPSLDRLQGLVRRIENATVDEFDFYLEAGYVFSFAGEMRICLRDRSVIKLDSRLSMFAATTETFCPTDSSVDKITQFITDPDNRLVIHCPSLTGSIDDIKNLAAACEHSVQKEIQKIILHDAAGKTMVEFSEIPAFPRKFTFVSQSPIAQINEVFNVSLAFRSDQSFPDQAGDPVYWVEILNECKLSDVPGDQIILKVLAFSKTVEGDQEINLAITDKKAQPAESYMEIEKKSQVIDIKEFVSTSAKESTFLASNQQNILASCLRLVKKQLEQYAEALFKGLKDVSGQSINIMIANICVIFDEKSIQIVLSQGDGNFPDNIRELRKVLNYCDLRDYAKRRFYLYIKI